MNQLSLVNDFQLEPQDTFEASTVYAELSKFNLSGSIQPSSVEQQTFSYFVGETSPVDRRQVYDCLLDDVKNHRLPAKVLLAYVVFEPNIKLARNATHDYIRYQGCEIPGEFQAVAELVELIRHNQIENPGAVLAGLVALKDRRINAVARMLRNELSAAEIRDFGRAQEGELCRASIEFCIDWLSDLIVGNEIESANVICSVLVLMVFHEERGLVVDYWDGHRVGFAKLPRSRTEKFEICFERIKPILERLNKLSTSRTTISTVIESWRDHCISARRFRTRNQL